MSIRVKRIAIPIVILLSAIILFIVIVASKAPPEKKEVVVKDFLVDAKPIFSETVEFLVYAQGAVKPKNATMLSAQVSGRVVSISDNFNEGGFFKKGEVLFELESDDYQTDLLLAEAELARAQALLDEEVARGRVAEQEWSSINSGIPPQLGLRKPQLAREQANLKGAKANLARAQRNLARTKITAPYDGLVRQRLVDLGQFVPLGTQVGELYSTDVAEVRLPLTDNDVAFIGDLSKEQAKVTLTASVAGKQHTWQGLLVRDEAVLDEARRVIYGVVEVKDPYNLKGNSHTSALKFGRFVSAAVSGVIAQGIVKLPRFVMRLDGTVLTVTEDKKIQINSVSVVRTDENFVYIGGGLPLDQKVVMSAVSTPYNGMPVRFINDKPEPSNDENTNKEELSL
ncbi:efflux RND transporter periplasmic adaptor subunit [Glaciecola sp. 2405UD65-10]|uniref:efflux RND transporter periplasmic adaptor subunit n=1 Tax=Glaciecola sp. 2405UD65-10 TaxID=3397244 RepID=UPI003B5A030F